MNTNAEDRDINQKLHEAIGKCWHEFNNDCICQKDGCCADNSFQNRNPAYDSDLNAAFDLVEFMRSKWAKENPDETQFWKFTVNDCCEHGWRVDIEWGHHDGDIPVAHAVDISLPRAIALASARALNLEVK